MLNLHFALTIAKDCSVGNWISEPWWKKRFHPVYSRLPFDGNINTTTKWMEEACPTQTMFYTRYYFETHPSQSSSPHRAFDVESRRFVSQDPECKIVYPYDFLNLLTNRRVILLGDSVMNQIWQTLVCLLVDTEESYVHVDWTESSINKIEWICPFGKVHCRPAFGTLRFHESNISIIGVGMDKYSKSHFFNTILYHRLSSEDIVITNLGLHMNTQSELDLQLNALFSDLTAATNCTQHSFPHIFFLETTPQHFNSSNGYYDKNEGFIHCPPLQANYFNQRQNLDWRNIIAKKYIDKYNEQVMSPKVCASTETSIRDNHHDQVTLIPIAVPLYSQYDAHIDSFTYSSWGFTDCTHWSIPSGVFDFIHSMIYHTIHDKLLVNGHNSATLLFHDNTLIKGSGRAVYLVRNNTKYSFSGLNDFIRRGFDFDQVITINDYEIEEIPYGGNLSG
eukprot:gene11254-15100_t